MKNLAIVLLLISFQAKAQSNLPIEQKVNYTRSSTYQNHYFKDINGVFDKFLGSWKYENATDLLEIRIYKAEFRDTGGQNFYDDELYIEFKYTQNGAVIFNTFGENRTYYISGLRFQVPSNTNKYRLLYLEPSQRQFKAYQYVDIEYIPNTIGGQPQLNWLVFSDPKSIDYLHPIMPMNMVFTKLP
jgi:hypothetical protein